MGSPTPSIGRQWLQGSSGGVCMTIAHNSSCMYTSEYCGPVAQAARSLGPSIVGDTSKSLNHPTTATPSTAPPPTTSTSPPTSRSVRTRHPPHTARTPPPCSAGCWELRKSSMTAARPATRVGSLDQLRRATGAFPRVPGLQPTPGGSKGRSYGHVLSC